MVPSKALTVQQTAIIQPNGWYQEQNQSVPAVRPNWGRGSCQVKQITVEKPAQPAKRHAGSGEIPLPSWRQPCPPQPQERYPIPRTMKEALGLWGFSLGLNRKLTAAEAREYLEGYREEQKLALRREELALWRRELDIRELEAENEAARLEQKEEYEEEYEDEDTQNYVALIQFPDGHQEWIEFERRE